MAPESRAPARNSGEEAEDSFDEDVLKRPSKGDLQSTRPTTRHIPEGAKMVKTFETEGSMQLESLRSHLHDRGRVKADDFHDIFGPIRPIFDSVYWTPQMERDLLASEDVRDALVSIRKVTGKKHTCLLALWKVCARVWRNSPIWIISKRFSLEYKPLRPWKADKIVWSAGFCDDLGAIIAHPLWDVGNHGELLAVLQFAVICRTDDRRPWTVPDTKSQCHAVLTLARDALAPHRENIGVVFQKALQRTAGTPALLSTLLAHLARIIGEQGYSQAAIPDGAYQIVEGDLKNIIAAINACVGLLPVQTARQMYLLARGASTDAPDGSNIAAIYERSYLNDLRALAIENVRDNERVTAGQTARASRNRGGRAETSDPVGGFVPQELSGEEPEGWQGIRSPGREPDALSSANAAPRMLGGGAGLEELNHLVRERDATILPSN